MQVSSRECEYITSEHEHESIDRTKENPRDIVKKDLCKAKEEEKDILHWSLRSLTLMMKCYVHWN